MSSWIVNPHASIDWRRFALGALTLALFALPGCDSEPGSPDRDSAADEGDQGTSGGPVPGEASGRDSSPGSPDGGDDANDDDPWDDDGGTTGSDGATTGDDPDDDDDGDDEDDAGEDTGSDDEGGDDPDTGAPPTDEVPDNGYCRPVANWDPAWVQLESEVLQLVNEYRARGADCGSAGSFGSAPALVMQPALRCAARVHSMDMAERDFFSHTNPSGESPWDRFERAGYSYSRAGENIAGGSATAQGTMDQWMNSDGHCANIMNPNFEEIGVGYHPGGPYGHLWTQTFGSP